MPPGWLTTSIVVPVILTIATALMFAPPDAAHWTACALFIAAALWMGVIGVMWFKQADKNDWTVWLRAAALAIAVLVGTPTMIYFAWPAQAQIPPGGVNGDCNVFGNNNINCSQINLAPKPRSFDDPAAETAKAQLLAIPKDKKIGVSALMGDVEAYNLASQIYDFMKGNGYQMKDKAPSQAMYSRPFVGLGKHENADGSIDLQVGAAH